MRNLPKQSFFKNKRVLVRVDFNIELKNRKVIDDFDILRALKTIKYVSGRAKYTLLISHLGNPGEGEGLRSLRPVGVHLSGLLRKKVYFVFDKLSASRIVEFQQFLRSQIFCRALPVLTFKMKLNIWTN